MPAQSLLGGMNQEATQLEMLGNITLLLAAMLERMPRVTGNDQVAASIETIPAISFAANQSIQNITGALATLTNIAQIGGKPAIAVSDAITTTGVAHLYAQITVS